MSIVLSHRTAWLVYHAPNRPACTQRLPSKRSELASSYPSAALIDQARSLLVLMGVEAVDLQAIDILVRDGASRPRCSGVVSHRCAQKLPPRSVCKLAPGIFVVSPELCFIQMGETFKDERELIEFGYELCGGYELPPSGEGDYRERLPLASTEGIRHVIGELAGMHGIKAARQAACYIRDGSRSPMETAHVMMVALPKRWGGLGVKAACMDYRIVVPDQLRMLTRRGSVVCDACVPKAKLDIEYNGFHHDEEQRKVEDEERRNVLEAMGFCVKVLTKAAFFNSCSCRRHLLSIMRILRMKVGELPEGFWVRQEELRRFVLRRWL